MAAQSPTHRSAIRDLVVRHPVITFVGLAYVLAAAWLLADRIDLGMVNGFGIIGSLSPALAAMIVSAWQRPDSSGVSAGRRWRLFGIIAVLTLAVLAALRFWHAAGWVTVAGIEPAPTAYPNAAAGLLDVVAAAAVAFILSGVFSARQGVRNLLNTLDLRNHPIRWYWWLIAVGFYPACIVVGNAISAAVGLPLPAPKVSGVWYWLTLDVVIMFLYFLIGGGGLEEPGWRGLALPHLQKRFSPLRSSLILGVIWAFWHWPVLLPGFQQGGILVVVFFLIQVIPLAILFTVVFNHTGGSLPVVILLHASINLTEIYLSISTLASGLWLLLILAAAVWMWRSPRNFSLRPA